MTPFSSRAFRVASNSTLPMLPPTVATPAGGLAPIRPLPTPTAQEPVPTRAWTPMSRRTERVASSTRTSRITCWEARTETREIRPSGA